MSKKFLTAILFYLSGVSAALAISAGRYGDVEVVAPASPARGLVILLSGADGLQPKDRARLDALANAGAIAVGVDAPAYLRNLEKAGPAASNNSQTRRR